MIKRVTYLIFSGIAICILQLSNIQPQVNAAVIASNWKAGAIIDDGLFYNGNEMSLAQIEQFLAQKVPVCDTWGAQPSEFGGGTRAQYGASVGRPAPFICLKDYYENPTTHENNLTTVAGQLKPIPSGSLSAAQIIHNAATTYGINPKALLVLLHKESAGPLTVDTWPFPSQYRNAMGYGCPDTAPCDPNYAGLYNQITNAASQFVRYRKYPTSYRHSAGHFNSVLYNPAMSCGASMVYIETDATAGLYNYTPYQPNQAALNNLYGTGDSCSAYGNRNFWRVYNDWFGSTTLPQACTGNEQQMPYVTRYYNPRTYMHFYSAYACDEPFLRWIGYRSEGAEFNTSPKDSTQAIPVYRYYNPQTRLHIWSIENLSPEQLLAGGTGYQVEAGVVFYVANSDIPNLNKVVRLYNPKTYLHIWAANPTPRELELLASLAGYTVNEGTAFTTQ